MGCLSNLRTPYPVLHNSVVGQNLNLTSFSFRAQSAALGSRNRLPFRPVGADAHIGLVLRTTCVAPVGGGLRPAPLARSAFAPIFRWFGTPPPPRRGGPMCPPVNGCREEPCPGRHTGRPLQKVHRPQNNGRGQSPAPTGRSRCQAGAPHPAHGLRQFPPRRVASRSFRKRPPTSVGGLRVSSSRPGCGRGRGSGSRPGRRGSGRRSRTAAYPACCSNGPWRSSCPAASSPGWWPPGRKASF